MPTRETLPERWGDVPLLKSTFLARTDGPEVIMTAIDDGVLIGPFCQHCGNRIDDHSLPSRRCPAIQLWNVIPPPSCECHGSVEQARRKLDPEAFQRAMRRAEARDRSARSAGTRRRRTT